MYQFEKNSRIYLKGEGQSPSGRTSKSPQMHSSTSPTHRSSSTNLVNGNKENCNGGQTATFKTLKDTKHRAVSSEIGDLTTPGETKTKTQMARAFQESQELYKTADSKAGLQTIKTRRVLKKTTTITRGENEKLEDNTNPDDLPEAKLRMKMEALKRRLEELEYRIDNMGPIAKDLDGIQRQLAELRDFDEDLNKCRTDLNEFVNLAEEYIKEDLIADPVALRRDIQALKDQFARIEDKAAKRLKMFEKALKHAEDQKRAEAEMEMKLNQLKKLLDELERRLDNMAPVGKDLATLQKQLAEMKDFENDLGEARRLLSDTKRLAEDFISNDLITDPDGLRRKLKGLEKQLACIEDKANERLRAIQDALNRAKAQRSAEQQFQLRLDDMKRELDELERRLDNMAPVSRDLNTLQQQLAEMNDFNQKLNGARRNLNELNKAGEDLIREGLISDPASLRASLKSLKEQLIRIEDKAARRMRDIQDALNHAENQKKAEAKIQLKLEQLKKLLDELERRLDNMAPVGKDLATLQKQLIEMREFETDLGNARRLLNETKRLAEDMISSNLISDPDLLRRQVKSLEEQLARIEEKANLRMKAIQDALKRAEAQRAAEAKFQLRLDDMKRELDEMERKLDNMGPIAKDLPGLQAQLAEINDFSQKLNGTRRNLNDLNKAGEDLIREDLIADPIALRAALKALKDQLARIEEKAAKRLRDIQDAMSRVAASDAIQDVKNWLERARKVLVDEENVFGDLDTVNALIEQHISFQEELAAHQPTMNEVKRMELELSNSSPKNGAIIRNEMSDLMQKWKEVENLTREKTSKLDEALRVAQQMHQSVGQLLEWLAEAEMKLRFAGSLPDDEQATKLELQEHEKFMRKLQSQCEQKDSILKLAKEILNKCHPDAEPVIKLNTNIIESRWEDIEAWAKQRGQRLNDHLRNLLDILELVEELSAWLSRHENRLLAEESEPLPDNGRLLEQLIDQHSGFMDELRKRELDVDRVIKIFASKSGSSTSKMILTTTTIKPAGSSSSLAGRSPLDSGKGSSSSGRLSANRSTTPTRTSYATYRDEYPDIRQPKARLMLDKWRSVWQLSVDKMQRLKDRVEHFKEIERLENFDFDEWRRRFITWVNAKKGRVMDFYRSIDDDNDGRISIDSFINGVLKSKFESSRLEMERVCEIIDKNNDGVIDNKEYLDSLRPDKPITDDEIIQDEVQRQVTKCTCSQRFKVYHVGEGRYRFGESQKLRLVRILRSTVMVRVGGGWEPLISFLQKNDPCRAKGRTNIELREQFILPEGASQAMAAFRSKMSPSR